jgi:hypothetical protein
MSKTARGSAKQVDPACEAPCDPAMVIVHPPFAGSAPCLQGPEETVRSRAPDGEIRKA